MTVLFISGILKQEVYKCGLLKLQGEKKKILKILIKMLWLSTKEPQKHYRGIFGQRGFLTETQLASSATQRVQNQIRRPEEAFS